jgi:hypothetical protein
MALECLVEEMGVPLLQSAGRNSFLSGGDKLRSPKAAGHAEQKVDKWWSNSAVY